jgi:hypothetical protein
VERLSKKRTKGRKLSCNRIVGCEDNNYHDDYRSMSADRMQFEGFVMICLIELFESLSSERHFHTIIWRQFDCNPNEFPAFTSVLDKVTSLLLLALLTHFGSCAKGRQTTLSRRHKEKELMALQCQRSPDNLRLCNTHPFNACLLLCTQTGRPTKRIFFNR